MRRDRERRGPCCSLIIPGYPGRVQRTLTIAFASLGGREGSLPDPAVLTCHRKSLKSRGLKLVNAGRFSGRRSRLTGAVLAAALRVLHLGGAANAAGRTQAASDHAGSKATHGANAAPSSAEPKERGVDAATDRTSSPQGATDSASS